MAGSCATATMRSRKLPVPMRWNSCSAFSSLRQSRTLSSLTAKWPCQNRAIFSCSGARVATMRLAHQQAMRPVSRLLARSQ